MNLAIAQHGDPTGWTGDENNMGEFLNKYILPILKITKTCDATNFANCMAVGSYKILYTSSEAYNEFINEEISLIATYHKSYTLADGSSIAFIPYVENGFFDVVYFYVDTNGLKGPNVCGRDLFILQYSKRDNKFGLYSYTEYKLTDDEGNTSDRYGKPYDMCNPSLPDNIGDACADRLLKEGAMNY